MEKIITSLDLGTSAIKIAVAGIKLDGTINLLGLYEAPARGISRGNIVDLVEASNSIESLMSRVKTKHGHGIFKVILSIGGVGFSSDRSKGALVLHSSARELTQKDVEKVTQAARNLNFSLDRFILHEMVEDYILDGQEGVKTPQGLFAKKIEVKLYTLFHSVAHMQNVISCVNYAGYDVEKIAFSGLASVNSVLGEDELKDGVIFMDIGSETTKIVVAAEDRIKFCSVLNGGSAEITRSISERFKIPFASAEKLKFDSDIIKDSANDKQVKVAIGNKQREIPESEINGTVQKKIDEFLTTVRKELKNSSFIDCVKSGIVVSGGGTLLKGFLKKVEDSFDMPVRPGVPQAPHLDLERPSHLFAPCIGALEHYAKEIKEKNSKFNPANPLSKITHKVTTFINDYF